MWSFDQYPDGTEKYVITKIEGKDSNFIMSDRGERFYPSFFNRFVNELNEIVNDSDYRNQSLRARTTGTGDSVHSSRLKCERSGRIETRRLLSEQMSNSMDCTIHFVDFIDHDYRRKYRVIERIGDIEFAGGMVGDQSKSESDRGNRFPNRSRIGSKPLPRSSV